MTMPFDRLVVHRLDMLPGDQPWDVIPELLQPAHTVCGEYPSATVAWSALETAGFRSCRGAVVSPPLEGLYDINTVLRLAHPTGAKVILARRAGS